MTLWEFAAMAIHLPRESATVAAIDPEASAWGLVEHLQAGTLDALRWLQWSKTKDGEKNRNRPKPIPRPGVVKDSERRSIGSSPMALGDLDEFLGWRDHHPAPTASRSLPPRDPTTGRFTTKD